MKLASTFIKINIQGLDALPNILLGLTIIIYIRLLYLEMLKKILASNVIYTCIDHNKKTLENYYDTLDEIFKKIKNVKMVRKLKNFLN